MQNLLYKIKANTPKEEIIKLLEEHSEIKFLHKKNSPKA